MVMKFVWFLFDKKLGKCFFVIFIYRGLGESYYNEYMLYYKY